MRVGDKLSAWRGPNTLLFGGDYNPEQWPREQVAEDIELMHAAGVNLVTLGVFSWAALERTEGFYDTDWLRSVIDELHEAGIAVDLATATASPPPWLTHRYPETMLEQRDGTRLWAGGRQNWCPSSPVYREKSLALVETLAQQFGDHPAVVMWHVSNELGCHNAWCYCEVSAASFRRWLRERYTTLDRLNEVWGTSFWSQRYSDWEQVLPPRQTPAIANPTQELDFRRFSSDELLSQYLAERDVLRGHTSDVPVTTNFMVMANFDRIDYASWAPHMDVVSNDHYTISADQDRHVELAFSADATRGLSQGDPWILMEHSPSAVNWQPRNRAKEPGEMRRNSIQHVARGADGVCFFQWRASRAGAEKFHSALVPHAGTDSKVWREVSSLGADLGKLAELAGSQIRANVALLTDYPSRWAASLESLPSVDADPQAVALAVYSSLWRAGVTVDIVPPARALADYAIVVVPSLYLIDHVTASHLDAYVRGGGCLVVTYFSGIVDENDHVTLGGYPGVLREALGINTDEFFPLQEGEAVQLDDGGAGTRWSENVRLRGAEAVVRFADGPLAGVPAITRHKHGRGEAWYVATHLDPETLDAFVVNRLREQGVPSPVRAPVGVERVRRESETSSYTFVINHRGDDVEVEIEGTDLLTRDVSAGSLVIPAGGVRVMRTPRA